MPQEQDLGLPSGPVISNTWHLSDTFWNARVSARQVGLFVPVTVLTVLLGVVLEEEDGDEARGSQRNS